MTFLEQKTDATVNLSEKYQETLKTKIRSSAQTTAVLPNIQTTVTRRMEGEIRLRYSPYDEPISETSTTPSP